MADGGWGLGNAALGPARWSLNQTNWTTDSNELATDQHSRAQIRNRPLNRRKQREQSFSLLQVAPAQEFFNSVHLDRNRAREPKEAFLRNEPKLKNVVSC
jgi:hypothetical protein